MRLELIDDLPLFRSAIDGSDFRDLVREQVGLLPATVPADLTYVSYEELEQLWTRTTSTQADVVVLVGTRPPLLTHRVPRVSAESVVCVATRRALDAAGRTVSVHVDDKNLAAVRVSQRVLVADDVAMSASTLLAVLASILPDNGTASSVTVRTSFATRRALGRLRDTCPGIDVQSQVTLDYEPIVGGTAIFLSDLLYGTLRGVPFLDQTELLRPFFGSDLAPLHRLRQALDPVSTAAAPPCQKVSIR